MIGLDQTGTQALHNSGAGVLVDNGSTANTIGGPVAGGRNFIAGNAEGVLVTGSATGGTVIAGNLIGTSVEGNAAVGNATAGISLTGGTGTTIGGTTTLARNIISGNLGDGVDIGSGVTSTVVLGDYIGTDQTGTNKLPNAGSGVSVAGLWIHHRRDGTGRRQCDLGQRSGGRDDHGEHHSRRRDRG